MNKIIIPVLASVLILGVVAISYDDVFAMKNKIFVGNLDWNTESQAFVVDVSVHHGIAKAAQNTDSTLSVALTITDPLTGNSENEFYAFPLDEFNLDFNKGKPIVFELNLPWDRLIAGLKFVGIVDVQHSGTLEFNFSPSPGYSRIDSGVSVRECESNVVCDDGAFCNGAETCDETGSCQAGTAPSIDDGIACTVDSCDEATDSIVHNADACNGDPIPIPP